MDFFGILTMAGGLAFFLYGMDVMGSGLSRASGGRLEMLLERLTNSRWKAVLLGAGVTAVIQSSSATTVMVVGDHEIVFGSGNHYGGKCGNDGDVLDPEPGGDREQ